MGRGQTTLANKTPRHLHHQLTRFRLPLVWIGNGVARGVTALPKTGLSDVFVSR